MLIIYQPINGGNRFDEKKQEFIGYVEKVDFPNKGYVKVDEETVIIKNVIPGQHVRGITTKRRNGKFLGRLLETVESAPDAVVAPCLCLVSVEVAYISRCHMKNSLH